VESVTGFVAVSSMWSALVRWSKLILPVLVFVEPCEECLFYIPLGWAHYLFNSLLTCNDLVDCRPCLYFEIVTKKTTKQGQMGPMMSPSTPSLVQHHANVESETNQQEVGEKITPANSIPWKRSKKHLLRKQKVKPVGSIAWASTFRRLQASYDKKWVRSRVAKRLRRLVKPIRRLLTRQGVRQRTLLRNRSALDVKGVIYAMYSTQSNKVYVGQTLGTAVARFQQHVWKAHAGKGTPLSQFIRKVGMGSMFIFPLEVIPKDKYMDTQTSKGRRKAFLDAATPRERFWMEHLHTYEPRGLNRAWALRNRSRPSRKSNTITKKKDLRRTEDKKIFNISNTSRVFGFRDTPRRCKYLEYQFQIGLLVHIKLAAYTVRNLYHMRSFLVGSGGDVMEQGARKAILNMLNAFLFSRAKPKLTEKAKVTAIVVEWQSRNLRRIRLRQILQSPEVISFYPTVFPAVVISTRLPEAVGLKVLNYSSAARCLNGGEPGESCPCRQLFPESFRPDGGCVKTGDVNLVEQRLLRKILSYGVGFRTRVAPNPLKSISEALDRFIHKQSQVEDMDSVAWDGWKACILKLAETRVQDVGSHSIAWNQESVRYLSFLHKHLVLSPIDKASNNVSFTCKRLYSRTLRDELLGPSGAYSISKRSEKEIGKAHQEFLSAYHLDSKPKHPVGYLFLLQKMHKIGQRFVAGLSNCSTTRCSKFLSLVLNFVLKTLREKDDASIRETGIRRYFVVPGFEEVAEFLSRWPRTSVLSDQKLYTGDFSTMYTSIPHADLITRVNNCVEEAWNWIADDKGVDSSDVYLTVDKESCMWVQRSARGGEVFKGHVRTISKLSVTKLVKFLVSNTFVMNGQTIRRQTIGLPMGTNCAPPLANLYLYSYESEFIDRVYKLKGAAAAHAFHMSFRLIDDVLSIDNPSMGEHVIRSAEEQTDVDVGGIYPQALTLNDTSVSSEEVNFLGMRIWSETGKLRLDVYDKRKDFPFEVIRYPNLDSLIPVHIPYGVFLGQLNRYYRICSEKEFFVVNTQDLVQTLLRQGCQEKRLRKCYRSFLSGKSPLRWKVLVRSLQSCF
jgi:hypothetical protein